MEHPKRSAGSADRDAGAAAEFWHFLKHNRTWWILPIAVVLLLLVLLVVLSGTAEAPFLYRLY
jgi:hypothetical protein